MPSPRCAKRAFYLHFPPLVEKADPHMDRVVELIALGWAPWNAQARAESEALPGREVRV